MSPILAKYQEFANLLELFHSDITHINAYELRQRFNKLKQYFLEEIIPCTDLTSQQQSYNTEISKQFGLLEIDIMFLQGAKQSATVEARRKTITERFNTLIRYCESIINPE